MTPTDHDDARVEALIDAALEGESLDAARLPRSVAGLVPLAALLAEVGREVEPMAATATPDLAGRVIDGMLAAAGLAAGGAAAALAAGSSIAGTAGAGAAGSTAGAAAGAAASGVAASGAAASGAAAASTAAAGAAAAAGGAGIGSGAAAALTSIVAASSIAIGTAAGIVAVDRTVDPAPPAVVSESPTLPAELASPREHATPTPSPGAIGSPTPTSTPTPSPGTSPTTTPPSLPPGAVAADLALVADDVSAVRDRPLRILVLANDEEPDLDPGTLTIVRPATSGETSVTDGEVVYTPAPGYAGPDGFAYSICTTDQRCDTAEVTVDVQSPPAAEDDTATTQPETAVTIAVLANDTDPDGSVVAGSVRILSAPEHGTATVNEDGTVTYTPAPGTTTDHFDYTVCDDQGLCDQATVGITISG